MADISIDFSQFQKALQEYERATRKDCADIINRAAKNVAYRAASFTPVASKSEVRAALMRDDHLRYALTSLSLKKIGIGAVKDFREKVSAYLARRANTVRYLRVGWAKAIIAMGGTFRGANPKDFDGGAGGGASKATPMFPTATIYNVLREANKHKATGAELIGTKALQSAVSFVAKDMMAYAEKKLSETAAKHSA